MKTMLKSAMLATGLFVASVGALIAQDAPAVPDFAAPAADPAPAAQSTELVANPDQSQPAAATKKSSTGFFAVVTGSGFLGVLLWLCLFGAGVAAIYFVFDCAILFKADKMIPKTLVDKVSVAMAPSKSSAPPATSSTRIGNRLRGASILPSPSSTVS